MKITIPLLQRVLLFACKKAKDPVTYSVVNQLFRETIIDFRTATLIWLRRFLLTRRHCSVTLHHAHHPNSLRALLIRCCQVDSLSWVIHIALHDLGHHAALIKDSIFDVSPLVFDNRTRVFSFDSSKNEFTSPLYSAIEHASLDNISAILEFVADTLNVEYRAIKSKTGRRREKMFSLKEERHAYLLTRSRCALACRIKNSITTAGAKGWYTYFVQRLAAQCATETDSAKDERAVKLLQHIVEKLYTIQNQGKNADLVRKFLLLRGPFGNSLLLKLLEHSFPLLNDSPASVPHRTTMTRTVKWILEESERQNCLGNQLSLINSCSENALMMAVRYERVDCVKEIISLFHKHNNSIPNKPTKDFYRIRTFFTLEKQLMHKNNHFCTVFDVASFVDYLRMFYIDSRLEILRLLLREYRRIRLIRKVLDFHAAYKANIFMGFVSRMSLRKNTPHQISFASLHTFCGLILAFCGDGETYDQLMKRLHSYPDKEPLECLRDDAPKELMVLFQHATSQAIVDSAKKWYASRYGEELI